MKLNNLLRMINGTQELRIIPYNSRKPLYEGTALVCDLDNRNVLAMRAVDNVLVIVVEF